MATTYIVDELRATVPEGKVAERNPERVLNVTGTFYSVKEDKGKIVKDQPMSFVVKYITREIAADPEFSLDLANGMLTLPAGERGRKPADALSAEDVAAILAAARGESTEDEADEADEAEDAS